MALNIKWTKQANMGLNKVIEYLEQEWTFREILNLEENIKQVTNQISVFPNLFPKSETYKFLHKALVDKNNYLVYRVNFEDSEIEIINFRGTKQKPKH
jgi:plasmid stabilization system protein ParE